MGTSEAQEGDRFEVLNCQGVPFSFKARRGKGPLYQEKTVTGKLKPNGSFATASFCHLSPLEARVAIVDARRVWLLTNVWKRLPGQTPSIQHWPSTHSASRFSDAAQHQGK